MLRKTWFDWARDGNEAKMVSHPLAKKRAALNVRNSLRQTALYIGAMNGHIGVVKLLLDLGADPRTSPLPLYIAACHGHTEVVELLLEPGTVNRTQNIAKQTPLKAAIERGHQSTAEAIVEWSARTKHTVWLKLSPPSSPFECTEVTLALTKGFFRLAAKLLRHITRSIPGLKFGVENPLTPIVAACFASGTEEDLLDVFKCDAEWEQYNASLRKDAVDQCFEREWERVICYVLSRSLVLSRSNVTKLFAYKHATRLLPTLFQLCEDRWFQCYAHDLFHPGLYLAKLDILVAHESQVLIWDLEDDIQTFSKFVYNLLEFRCSFLLDTILQSHVRFFRSKTIERIFLTEHVPELQELVRRVPSFNVSWHSVSACPSSAVLDCLFKAPNVCVSDAPDKASLTRRESIWHVFSRPPELFALLCLRSKMSFADVLSCVFTCADVELLRETRKRLESPLFYEKKDENMPLSLLEICANNILCGAEAIKGFKAARNRGDELFRPYVRIEFGQHQTRETQMRLFENIFVLLSQYPFTVLEVAPLQVSPVIFETDFWLEVPMLHFFAWRLIACAVRAPAIQQLQAMLQVNATSRFLVGRPLDVMDMRNFSSSCPDAVELLIIYGVADFSLVTANMTKKQDLRDLIFKAILKWRDRWKHVQALLKECLVVEVLVSIILCYTEHRDVISQFEPHLHKLGYAWNEHLAEKVRIRLP